MTSDPDIVLDPVATEYVLPPPPKHGGGDVVVVAPRADLARAWRRGSEVARALGDRFVAQVESQQLFGAELRERLLALDAAAADATRAQWKGAVREVLAVLDWSDAVQQDLLREARLAASGAEPIDVADLCQEVGAQVQTAELPVFVRGQAHSPWWGSATALAEVVRQALGAVAERAHGTGARTIEVGETGGRIHVCIAADGEPTDGVEAATVARFRRAVEQIGAAVRPGALGPGGTGLLLELPPSPPAGA
jgi:hypothetical protein